MHLLSNLSFVHLSMDNEQSVPRHVGFLPFPLEWGYIPFVKARFIRIRDIGGPNLGWLDQRRSLSVIFPSELNVPNFGVGRVYNQDVLGLYDDHVRSAFCFSHLSVEREGGSPLQNGFQKHVQTREPDRDLSNRDYQEPPSPLRHAPLSGQILFVPLSFVAGFYGLLRSYGDIPGRGFTRAYCYALPSFVSLLSSVIVCASIIISG